MKEELSDYIKHNRRDFASAPLTMGTLATKPSDQFELWFDQALKSAILDPYAFALATANSHGAPSVRMVYMRDYTERGLGFFTNYHSQKGLELIENPQFGANFYWAELSRQVRFCGAAEKMPDEESDAYFASRPRESQLGAWASEQSAPLEDRTTLQAKLKHFDEKFASEEVPRPPHWGGFLLHPEEVEFWQGRPARLHDRFVYSKSSPNRWEIRRLSP